MILRNPRGLLPMKLAVFRRGRIGIPLAQQTVPGLVQEHQNADDCSASTSESSDGYPTTRRRVSKLQIKLHRRAKALQSQGKLEDALSVLYQGLSLFPRDMHMLSLAACVELKLNNVDRAEKLLKEELLHTPMHPTLLVVSGLLHARRGALDQARECFRIAHDREPQKAATVLQVRQCE